MIRKHSIMSAHKDETAWRAEQIKWSNKYELNARISDQNYRLRTECISLTWTTICSELQNHLSWLSGERWATDCHTEIEKPQYTKIKQHDMQKRQYSCTDSLSAPPSAHRTTEHSLAWDVLMKKNHNDSRLLCRHRNCLWCRAKFRR